MVKPMEEIIMEDSSPIVDDINEKEALARAKEEGIEFVDEFKVDGLSETFNTLKDAEKAREDEFGSQAKHHDVIQIRRQK